MREIWIERGITDSGKDLLDSRWSDVEYPDFDKMVWIEDIWYKE